MSATVVLSVSDQFSAPLQAYNRETGMALQGTEGLAAAMARADAATAKLAQDQQTAAGAAKIHADATQNSTLKLADLYYGVGLVTQGFAALKGGYESVMNPSIDLANQTRKLQFAIGATAEDAGKLIYAADQAGVSFNTLQTGLKAAIRTMQSHKSEGIAPTIEGLGQLADKYNALQDPIARTAFLMHNFGRSGADLAPLMALGGAGIKGLGDQAIATGSVLDQQGVDSLHHLDMATKTLTTSMTGFKVAVAEEAAPAAATFFSDLTAGIQNTTLLRKAQADGIDTSKLVNYTYQDGIKIITNLADANKNLTAAIDKHDAALNTLDPAIANYINNLGDAKAATDALNEPTGKLIVNEYAIQKSMDASNDSFDKQIAAMRKTTDAARDLSINQLVHAGLAGTVTKNYEAYDKVLDSNADKIAKLRAEIDRYTAAQGQNITVVLKGQFTAEQYSDAQTRLGIALLRQSEYHGKSQATVMSMQLAVDNARDAIDKMSDHMAGTTTTTADYSKKIGEDQAALDKLTLANSRAEDAMHKANREFAVQTASAGLTGKALLDFDLAMGVIDKPTYAATLALQAANAQFAKDKDLLRYESAVGLVIDQLNGVPAAADKIPEVLKPATDAFWAAADASRAAADNINAIPDVKNITVNYNEYHHTNRDNAVVGAAGGANFTVPPGYPNDSYRLNVQSGEHVIVIPAPGGHSGGGITFNGGINIHGAGQVGEGLARLVATELGRMTRAQIMSGAQALGQ